jgi:hypothetical protein
MERRVEGGAIAAADAIGILIIIIFDRRTRVFHVVIPSGLGRKGP